MKLATKNLLIGAMAAVASVGTVNAATVTASAPVFDQPNWATAGYGDTGYAFFDDNNNSPITSFTGGVLDTGGSVGLTALRASDPPLGSSIEIETPDGLGTFTPGSWYNYGIAGSNFADIFKLTFTADYISEVGTNARIGILIGASQVNTSTNPGGFGDYPRSINIAGTTQAVTQRSTYQADWYFFEVTGLAAGDELIVSGQSVADAANEKFNPVNGVVISAAPEPGSLALLGLGGLLIGARRRRA